VGGEVRGNYCTWNPLLSAASLSNGNLDIANLTANFEGCTGTIYVSSGKYYFEFTNSYSAVMIGVCTNDNPLSNSFSASTTSWTYYSNGQKFGNGANGVSYGASFTTGDIIGVALDMDAGSITFYKNGVSQGVAFSTGLSGKVITPLVSSFVAAGAKGSANFGQRAFAYPLSTYKALCTQNLPAPLVTKSNTVMDVALWTGNGSTQNITGLAFSPDLVWVKARSYAYPTFAFDAIRGATNYLMTSSTGAEDTIANSLTSFNSDGFSLGASAYVNYTSNTFVGWAWDAGTSTVSNPDGSITSQVRANATAGFSVSTFTGATTGTIGHGLGVAPSMIIMKARTSNPGANDWFVYHKDIGNTKALLLNSTAATNTYTYWNNTSPTSTVFSIGSGIGTPDWVAYAFAPVVGYSSAFTWSGTGSTDGPAIYLGFRPKLIIWKRTDSAANWAILDSSRSSYNVADDWLGPNSSSSESADNAAYAMDFLSNGLKIRATHEATNQSGGTYIGFAWAEAPFNYSRAR
jgi:hypothetical protein